jgi:lysylphosphatidylglycerol synthetase-like protein (DUF2156 family)
MTLGDRPPAGRLQGASVVAASGLVLTWLLDSLPAICPAVYPAPDSCSADARLLPAIVTSAAIVVVFVAILLLARGPGSSRRSGLSTAAMVALVLVTVVGLSWTLTASGFASGW